MVNKRILEFEVTAMDDLTKGIPESARNVSAQLGCPFNTAYAYLYGFRKAHMLHLEYNEYMGKKRNIRLGYSDASDDVPIKDAGTTSRRDNPTFIVELREQIELLLETLSQKQAEVVRMFYFEDMSSKDIALAKKCSVSNINMLLSIVARNLKPIALKRGLKEYL